MECEKRIESSVDAEKMYDEAPELKEDDSRPSSAQSSVDSGKDRPLVEINVSEDIKQKPIDLTNNDSELTKKKSKNFNFRKAARNMMNGMKIKKKTQEHSADGQIELEEKVGDEAEQKPKPKRVTINKMLSRFSTSTNRMWNTLNKTFTSTNYFREAPGESSGEGRKSKTLGRYFGRHRDTDIDLTSTPSTLFNSACMDEMGERRGNSLGRRLSATLMRSFRMPTKASG